MSAYATQLIPYAGATVTDPTTAEAIDWTGVVTPTAFVVVHNTSATDAAFLVTASDATESGRAIGPGATAAFGPYSTGVDLWIVGGAADPVHYSFDGVFREI